MSNLDQLISDMLKFWDGSKLRRWYISNDAGANVDFSFEEELEEANRLNNFFERLKSYQ